MKKDRGSIRQTNFLTSPTRHVELSPA
jgi:hypothetical protein